MGANIFDVEMVIVLSELMQRRLKSDDSSQQLLIQAQHK
jgi:hypothetical protein